MDAIIQRIQSHPHYSKVMHWGKLISITGSAQIIVQAVGFICGILVIRLLPTQEYALYTLANTMLGTMTVLADGGISSGVMSQGGKVWQDKLKLGVVLATGLDLRRKFANVSLIVSSPILLYLLLQHGASWSTAILIILSLIPAFYAALSDSLLEIVPKLNQSILPLQKNQVSVGIGRLLLSGLALFVFPWTIVAILASGFPRIYGNIKLRKIAYSFADKDQEPDAAVRKNISLMIRRILPGAIYYCVSGQITIWLISVFGNTTSVAQLGALGRFSMLLTLFNVLIGTLVVPRFARLSEKKTILMRRYIQILLLLLVIVSFIVSLVYLFPDQILWILGNNYSGLQHELVLSILGSCLSLMAGVVFSLYTCRGWMIKPSIYIPINLLSIIASIFLFDVSLLKGILYLNIMVTSVQLLVNLVYVFYKMKRVEV